MSGHPTRFDSVLDLARLPWFSVEGGNRLVLAEGAADEIGPVVDSHTHLAMDSFADSRSTSTERRRRPLTTCR